MNAFWSELYLAKLPDHLPLLLASALCWQAISWLFSAVLFPFFLTADKFERLTGTVSAASAAGKSKPSSPTDKAFRREQWGIQAASLIHALLISSLSLTLLYWDDRLLQDKIFGYTKRAGDVYAVTCGYFLWDVWVSVKYRKHYGMGFILHAICCLAVYLFSFRPFLMWYGSVYLLFELSTPFLYLNWFFDKFGMTGSRWQMLNGIVLIITFTTVRLLWGSWMSWQFFQDLLIFPQSDRPIPRLHKLLYPTANVILTALNFLWLYKIIMTVLKRRRPRTRNEGPVKLRHD